MSAKWSVAPIIRQQLGTLTNYDDPKRRPRVLDYLSLFGIPLALGAAAFFFDFRLRGTEGILAGVAVFTALLFGLLVHAFTLGIKITDDPRIPNTGRTAHLIDQLMINVTYSVVVGLATTIVLIVGVGTTLADHAMGVVISSISVVGICHLILSILMALKRLFSAYQQFRL